MNIYATLSLLAPTNTRLIRVHSRVMIVYDNKVDQIQLDCSSRLDSLKQDYEFLRQEKLVITNLTMSEAPTS